MGEWSGKVELHPAHTWDCESCGTENFCRGVVMELSNEERKEIAERYEVEDWEEGHWMTMPAQVTCSFCGASYETEHQGEEPESWK